MPAKRELTMRQLRQMLRLHHDGLGAREIGRLLRDNLDENGATIWMRRGGRAERQLTMAAVLARL
jgi:hypothetical protein